MGYHTCHGVVMGYRLITTPSHQVVNQRRRRPPAPGESPKSWSTKSTSDPQIVADPMTISYQLWKTSPGFTNFRKLQVIFFVGFPSKSQNKIYQRGIFNTENTRVSVLTNVKSTVFVGTTIPGDQQWQKAMHKRWKADEFLLAQTISVPNFG